MRVDAFLQTRYMDICGNGWVCDLLWNGYSLFLFYNPLDCGNAKHGWMGSHICGLLPAHHVSGRCAVCACHHGGREAAACCVADTRVMEERVPGIMPMTGPVLIYMQERPESDLLYGVFGRV